MWKEYRWVFVLIGTLSLSTAVAAGQPLRWEPTLESAKRRAAQTDRLVLIHFTADWCTACRTMEQEVFDQPGVAAAVQTYYVPVKINADYFPATRKQYGVTALPTDVIITPQGQQIEKIRGPIDAFSYVAQLNRVVAAVQGRGAETYAQGPGAPPPAAMTHATPPPGAAGYQGANVPRDPDDRYANYFDRQPQGPPMPAEDRYNDLAATQRGRPQQPFIPPAQARPQQPLAPPQQVWPQQPNMPQRHTQFQPPIGPPMQAQPGPPMVQPPMVQPPPGPPQVVQSPAVNPPLCLDGYCPVQLTESVTWTLGNRLWGARHRGRTYLFAGAEQQRRFLAQPDRYAPVLSGDDVVLAAEENRQVQGERKHGVFFGGKVYLFASEASLEKFGKNPNLYANRALQAMQARIYQGQRLR